MKEYSVDHLMEKTKNKYVLCQVISKRAREIRGQENFVLGYKAINEAARELMEGDFTYSVPEGEDEGAPEED